MEFVFGLLSPLQLAAVGVTAFAAALLRAFTGLALP